MNDKTFGATMLACFAMLVTVAVLEVALSVERSSTSKPATHAPPVAAGTDLTQATGCPRPAESADGGRG